MSRTNTIILCTILLLTSSSVYSMSLRNANNVTVTSLPAILSSSGDDDKNNNNDYYRYSNGTKTASPEAYEGYEAADANYMDYNANQGYEYAMNRGDEAAENSDVAIDANTANNNKSTTVLSAQVEIPSVAVVQTTPASTQNVNANQASISVTATPTTQDAVSASNLASVITNSILADVSSIPSGLTADVTNSSNKQK